MNIIELLQKNCNDMPEKTAIICGNEKITYKELEQRSACMAAYLRAFGLKKGDGILLFIPMSIDLYVVLAATFRLEMTAIFIDPYAGVKYIENCCNLFPPKVIIAKSLIFAAGYFSKAIREIPIKISVEKNIFMREKLDDYKKCTPYYNIEETIESLPALITFTSGTTGIPKIIERRHGFLLDQHNSIERSMGIDKNFNVMVSFPIFLLSHLATGATTVIPDGKLMKPERVKPEKLVDQIIHKGIDTVILPPIILSKITDYCNSKKIVMDNIGNVYTGGAPVFPSLLDRLKEVMPIAKIHSVYGSSEAEPIAHLNYGEISSEDIAKMKTGNGLLAGIPVKEIEIRIANPVNGIGEIIVSGNHVLKYYLNGDNENIKIKDGEEIWHRTGDSGYLDENGRLWLTGRVKSRIKTGNRTIYSLMLETILSWNPEIRKSAAVLIDGEPIMVIEGNLNNMEEVKEKLNEFGIKRVIKMKKIPVDKRHNGKILYDEIS